MYFKMNRRGPVSHQPSELPDADYDLEVDEDEMVFIGQGDEPPTDWAALAREQEEADRQNEIAEVADAPSTVAILPSYTTSLPKASGSLPL